jgi:uncharacterized protein
MSRFLTVSGVVFDLENPTADMIVPEDIAHALSRIERYGGHSKSPINVAAHSVAVAWILEWQGWGPETQLEGLCHDMPEAYTGDVIQPLKRMLGEGFAVIERRVERAVAERFDLPHDFAHGEAVKVADWIAYGWERRDVVEVPARDAPSPELLPTADFYSTIGPLFRPDAAKARFLNALDALLRVA